MNTFIEIILAVLLVTMLLFAGVLIGGAKNYPDVPKYYEVVGQNFGDILLVEDSNHIQYYLFTEDGKIVKIKKQ